MTSKPSFHSHLSAAVSAMTMHIMWLSPLITWGSLGHCSPKFWTLFRYKEMEKGQGTHWSYEKSVRLAGFQFQGTAAQTGFPEAVLEPSRPRQETAFLFLEQTYQRWAFSPGMWLAVGREVPNQGCCSASDFSYSFKVICAVYRFGRMSSLISGTLELSLLGYQAREV